MPEMTQAFLKQCLLKSIQASIRAGSAILDVYYSNFSVEYKTDNSPLTLADKRSHGIIVTQLSEFNIPILSEEGRDIAYETRKEWDLFWLVDPLDGTKDFIKCNGEFTVNIALIQNGKPIMGIIYVPVKKTLFFAAVDIGAYKLELNGAADIANFGISHILKQAKRLAVQAARPSFLSAEKSSLPDRLDPETRPYTVVGSRSHSTPELESFVAEKRKEFPDMIFISAGSSLKFCLVAEGKADIYPRFGPTSEWDTAAGQAIAEGAGATVCHYETGKPLYYNKENLLNPWFMVKVPELPFTSSSK